MSRKKARDKAFLLLFQMDAQKATPDEIFEINPIADEYIEKVVRGVYDNITKLDELIKLHLRDWTIERLRKVSLCALRLALYEAEYVDDVPPNVAISEAITLVKKYEDEEGASFVNGVLGEISRRK